LKGKENPTLTAALQYVTAGLSVIPVKTNKRPLIDWKPFQDRRASQDEIREWFQRWPHASLAVITGPISGLLVIDIDKEEGAKAIRKYVYLMPTAEVFSPNGRHLYYRHTDGLPNTSNILPGVDVRTTGGYVLVPPSTGYEVGESGRFWVMDEVRWIPQPLYQVLQQAASEVRLPGFEEKPNTVPSAKMGGEGCSNSSPLLLLKEGVVPPQLLEKKVHLGRRDVVMYHYALNLRYRGYGKKLMLEALTRINAECFVPPLDRKQVYQKVMQAMKNKEPRSEQIPTHTNAHANAHVSPHVSTDMMKEWVEEGTGWFSTKQMLEELGIPWSDRNRVYNLLKRMIDTGDVIRDQNRRGWYRRINKASVRLDLGGASNKDAVHIRSPLGLTAESLFSPGQIYLVAGLPNSGKTTWCLNVAKDNVDNFKVYYFNMESSAQELATSIRRFPDVDVKWFEENVEFRRPLETDQPLGDLIVPGEGNLNIIDYLDPPAGDYSQMKPAIDSVFNRLEGAMAVIALQQWSPDQDHPAGGKGVIARPRLAIALLREPSRGRSFVKILKDKVTDGQNDGDIIYFNLNWHENRFEAMPGHEPDYSPSAERRPMGQGILYEMEE
jgi:hypothetical protein